MTNAFTRKEGAAGSPVLLSSAANTLIALIDAEKAKITAHESIADTCTVRAAIAMADGIIEIVRQHKDAMGETSQSEAQNLSISHQPVERTEEFDHVAARKELNDLEREILKRPLVQSLLYDVNLLPEQIRQGKHWFYMLSILAHMDQAMKREVEQPDESDVEISARAALWGMHDCGNVDKVIERLRPFLRLNKRESIDEVYEQEVKDALFAFVKKHHTQNEAAKVLGMSQAHLSDMLRGIRGISVDTALALGFAKEWRYTRLKRNEIEGDAP